MQQVVVVCLVVVTVEALLLARHLPVPWVAVVAVVLTKVTTQATLLFSLPLKGLTRVYAQAT